MNQKKKKGFLRQQKKSPALFFILYPKTGRLIVITFLVRTHAYCAAPCKVLMV